MKHLFIILLFCFLLTNCSFENRQVSSEESLSNRKIIAYVNEWKDNWGDNYEKANLITHINYAFANIEDGEVTEGKDTDTETIEKLNGLKRVNKDLKILISVGGWTWSGNFSDAALNATSREKFANSAIAFMLKHKIDGIDLDWEYPGLPGVGNVFREEDRENFTSLLKLIREKLDAIDENEYLLTIATGASQDYLDHTNMKEAHQYLDFINIMTYDFHGGWERKTGHNANLFASKADDNESVRSAELAVMEHINAGIPANKIVLGVPFYGRWWKGVDPKNNGLFQEATGEGGSYNYNEIKDSLNSDSGFISNWDSSARVPFIWRQKDSLFVSYDDERSMKHKVDFVKKVELGGIMFWQFNGDNGDLLKVISDSL